MNDVRRVTAVGLVIIGMLGVGMPAAFAASSPPPCPLNHDCSSYAPENAGLTTYYPSDGSYHIHNQSRGGMAVQFFHHEGVKSGRPEFSFCDKLDCSFKQLPEGFKGSFCMVTAVVPIDKKDDYQKPDLYAYSVAVCYPS